MCLICRKDLKKGEKEAKGHSGHTFCHDCWLRALKISAKVTSEPNRKGLYPFAPIKCFVPLCKRFFSGEYILSLLNDSEVWQVYKEASRHLSVEAREAFLQDVIYLRTNGPVRNLKNADYE